MRPPPGAVHSHHGRSGLIGPRSGSRATEHHRVRTPPAPRHGAAGPETGWTEHDGPSARPITSPLPHSVLSLHRCWQSAKFTATRAHACPPASTVLTDRSSLPRRWRQLAAVPGCSAAAPRASARDTGSSPPTRSRPPRMRRSARPGRDRLDSPTRTCAAAHHDAARAPDTGPDRAAGGHGAYRLGDPIWSPFSC